MARKVKLYDRSFALTNLYALKKFHTCFTLISKLSKKIKLQSVNKSIKFYSRYHFIKKCIFQHFKQWHSHSDPSSLLLNQISFKENLSNLEQTKDIQDVLDSPISISAIENMAKSLKPKKASGPDKIRNEMLKTGIKWYRKIPKISLGACIFQRPFLKGLIFGGVYIRRGLCTKGNLRFKVDWTSV